MPRRVLSQEHFLAGRPSARAKIIHMGRIKRVHLENVRRNDRYLPIDLWVGTPGFDLNACPTPPRLSLCLSIGVFPLIGLRLPIDARSCGFGPSWRAL